MHNTVKNLLDIENDIKDYLNKLNINNNPKIVAVSKTFKIDKDRASYRAWPYRLW